VSAPVIAVRGAGKRFPDGTRALDNVSLDIAPGEFFALLGPSGCGKTTLLRLIAGLETPSEGRIEIAGADMAGVPPNRRPVNMVFQSYALFPHMTVEANVGYGLAVAGVAEAERRARVADVLALVKLEGLGARKPDQLSGGQRQRVALARALVNRPKVLLLDEPLSALDAKLREAMRAELVNLQRSLGIAFVLVTHDQGEALATAGRVAAMEAGRVRQIDAPRALYERPRTRFVAAFIGKANLFDAAPAAGGLACRGLGVVPLAAEGCVALAVRPERVRVEAAEPEAGRVRLRARLADRAYFGGETELSFAAADGTTILARRPSAEAQDWPSGTELWLSWRVEDCIPLFG